MNRENAVAIRYLKRRLLCAVNVRWLLIGVLLVGLAMLSCPVSGAAATEQPTGAIAGTVEVAGAKTNADAVVYIAEVPGQTFKPSAEHAVLDQRKMLFVPRVLAVQVGTTVEFHNSDSVSHNIFTPAKCAGSFNLGTWGKGQVRSHTFDRPCVAVILCNLHPEMVAWVVVVPTPYMAVTDANGEFVIDAVPEGTYTLTVWHPKADPVMETVAVTGRTEVNLKVGG